MSDVVVFQLVDSPQEVLAVKVPGSFNDVTAFVERVADHVRDPVRWAVVEVIEEVGPGDVADALADPGTVDEVPTSTWQTMDRPF